MSMSLEYREFEVILDRPHRLGRMGRPRPGCETAVLRELTANGITSILSLLSLTEQPVGWDEGAAKAFTITHVPIDDEEDRPTLAEVDVCVAHLRAQRAAGHGVVVHCAAGLGRTGTILACYLRDFAEQLELCSAEDVFVYLRRFQSSMVETPEQEERVRDYWRPEERTVPLCPENTA